MKCKDIMTKNLKNCMPDSSIKEAIMIMKDFNCGVVPVVNHNGNILGIITDRDIAINVILNNKDPEKSIVKDFMTEHVITCNEDEDIDEATSKMKDNKVRRIPVLNKENKLTGIISIGDIAVMSGEEHETFTALENISKPVSKAK